METRFDVDMSFSASEITTMLKEYEEQHQTGMDIAKVSQITILVDIRFL